MSISKELNIGDWIRHEKEVSSGIKYIKITPKNIGFYKNDFVKINYVLVKGEEILKAENYLEELLNLGVGNYVAKKNGVTFWIDRISKLPELKFPFDISDYQYSMVGTERGHWLWYLDAPYAKVSEEEAEKYFLEQIKKHQENIRIFKTQLRNLGKLSPSQTSSLYNQSVRFP